MSLESEARDKPEPLVSDPVAYVLPMGIFLAFTWVGGNWPAIYPITYAVKVVVVALALIVLWRHYTKISWRYWWLGVIVGVIGTFQWIGMQLWLQNHSEFFKPSPEVFNPFEIFHSPAAVWSFIVVRMIGAVIVVPVMEELFWRSLLMRWLQSAQFEAVVPRRIGPKAIVLSTFVFMLAHTLWLAAVIAGLAYALLYVRTGRLWVPIIAHAVTNGALGIWVVHTQQWVLW